MLSDFSAADDADDADSFIYHLTIYNLRFCILYLVNGLMNCHVELVETSHIMLSMRYVKPLDYARGDRAKPLLKIRVIRIICG